MRRSAADTGSMSAATLPASPGDAVELDIGQSGRHKVAAPLQFAFEIGILVSVKVSRTTTLTCKRGQHQEHNEAPWW